MSENLLSGRRVRQALRLTAATLLGAAVFGAAAILTGTANAGRVTARPAPAAFLAGPASEAATPEAQTVDVATLEVLLAPARPEGTGRTTAENPGAARIPAVANPRAAASDPAAATTGTVRRATVVARLEDPGGHEYWVLLTEPGRRIVRVPAAAVGADSTPRLEDVAGGLELALDGRRYRVTEPPWVSPTAETARGRNRRKR